MKSNKYQERLYRGLVKTKDLYSSYIITRETDLEVFTDKPVDESFIKERVNFYRRNIDGYIAKDSRFLTALKPLEVELVVAPIVKRMAEASKRVNVGPMAAVAGAIAEFVGKDLLKKGYKDVIIENGGDIFIATTKSRKVGIYAGKSKIWNKLSIKIESKDTPMGICTSSGKIGHSLSFGSADAVTVLSKNSSLADAAATAVANRVNSQSDLKGAVDFAKSIRGISGIVIIIKRHLISWGKIKFTG